MSFLNRLVELLPALLKGKATPEASAEADASPPSARPTPLSSAEAHALSDVVRKDWARLINLLLEAAAPLVPQAKDEESVEAMALRIAVRTMKIGAHGIAWSTEEPVGKGFTGRKTKAIVKLLELETCKADALPHDLERAATAFLATSEVAVVDGQRRLVRADDGAMTEKGRINQERRDRATLAAFYAYVRLVAEMQEEIALAAQTSSHVKPVSQRVAEALREVGAVPIAPAAGELPVLTHVKVCGYVEGEPIGSVATVVKPGILYRSEVVRKADVTVRSAKKPAPAQDEAS